MKILLLFLFATLCVSSYGQAGMAFRNLENPKEWIFDREPWQAPIPDSILWMSLEDAAKVEYWGQKGIASVPLIATLEQELEVSAQQEVFNKKILSNCQAYQEEYRQKLERVSVMYNNKASDYIELQVDRDMWKKKAQNRGKTLWTIGGAAALLIFGIAVGI